MCWRSLGAIALVLAFGATSRGQDVIKTDRIGLGGSEPSGTSAIVATPASIPATTGSDNFVYIDSSGLFRKGALSIPSTYLQRHLGEAITGVFDFQNGLRAASIRASSASPFNIRNLGNTATIAAFGDAAITLSQPTTITGNSSVTGTWGVTGLSTLTGGFSAGANSSVTGTFGVSGATTLSSTLAVTGLSTLTGGYSAGASSSIAGNLTLTGTGNVTAAGDVAVNGGDLTSTAANLNITPATSITLNGQTRLAASHTLQSANFASRTTGWGITYAGEADFRYTYADEFYTKNFIADLETALNGGQIIAKSTVILAQNFTCPAAGGTATLWVRDFPGHGNLRVFAASDWVVLRSMTRADADNDGNIEFSIGDCVGQVSAYADGTSANEGTQSWTFTRGSGGNAGAMASSTVIAADALVIDFGVSGQGVLVARANDGTEGSQSPYWQVATWTTSPVAANFALRTRWGQLNGSYGYSAAEYGFAAGDAAGINITAEATNGFRIRSGTTTYGQMSTSGLTIGRTDSGYGNWFADTSGNLYGRSGTVNRLHLGASNANIDWLDDDGTTVRARIGATDTYLGSVSGGRFQYTYSSGRASIYDGGGNLRLWADATSGLVLGPGANGSGVPYAQLTSTSLLFCRDSGSCPLTFSGSTGDITSRGNILLSTGGNVTSTGNFSLSNANGLVFTPATGTYSSPKAITWGSVSGTAVSTRVYGSSVDGSLAIQNYNASGVLGEWYFVNASGENRFLLGGRGASSSGHTNRIAGGVLGGVNILGGIGGNWQIYIDAPAAIPSGTGNKVLLVNAADGRIQYANAGFTGSCSGVPNSVINGLIMSC